MTKMKTHLSILVVLVMLITQTTGVVVVVVVVHDSQVNAIASSW